MKVNIKNITISVGDYGPVQVEYVLAHASGDASDVEICGLYIDTLERGSGTPIEADVTDILLKIGFEDEIKETIFANHFEVRWEADFT